MQKGKAFPSAPGSSSFPVPPLMQNDKLQVGLRLAGAMQFPPSYQTSANLFSSLEKVRCCEPGLRWSF